MRTLEISRSWFLRKVEQIKESQHAQDCTNSRIPALAIHYSKRISTDCSCSVVFRCHQKGCAGRNVIKASKVLIITNPAHSATVLEQLALNGGWWCPPSSNPKVMDECNCFIVRTVKAQDGREREVSKQNVANRVRNRVAIRAVRQFRRSPRRRTAFRARSLSQFRYLGVRRRIA